MANEVHGTDPKTISTRQRCLAGQRANQPTTHPRLFEATDQRLEVSSRHSRIRLGVEVEPLLEDTSPDVDGVLAAVY